MKRRDSHQLEVRLNRRNLLQLTAAGAATATAGCMGGDSNSGKDDTATNAIDQVQASDLVNARPNDAQFNEYNPTNRVVNEWGTFPMYDRFLRYIPDIDEYETRVVSDYELGDKQVDLEIGGHGHTWHDGDPVTAQDIYTQLRLWEYVGQTIWKFLDDIEVIDEQTLRLHTSGSVNEDVLLQSIGFFSATVKHEIYEEWLTKIEDAGSEEKRKEAVANLIDWTLSGDESVGTGPFALTEQNPDKLKAERYADYPWAENINYSGYEALPYNEDSARIQALRSGELDGVSFFVIDQQTQETLPDSIKRIDVADFGGYALQFNHSNPHLQNRNVRQAIAHVINRANVVSNIGGSAAGNTPAEYPCGVMGGSLFETIIGEPDGFETYGPDSSNNDKATTLLQDARYQKNNDTWVGPDGSKITLNFVGPTWDVMATACETMTSQLKRFGFNVNLSILEPATFDKRFQTGNYDLELMWWGGGAMTPHPYFSFVLPFSAANERELLKYPKKTEVPWPPGESGSTQTINVEEKLTKAGSLSGEEANKRLRELAWVWNQDLPNLPLTDRFMTAWHSVEEWSFPEDKNPDTSRVIESDNPQMNVQQPYEWLPRKGLLQAKSDSS